MEFSIRIDPNSSDDNSNNNNSNNNNSNNNHNNHYSVGGGIHSIPNPYSNDINSNNNNNNNSSSSNNNFSLSNFTNGATPLSNFTNQISNSLQSSLNHLINNNNHNSNININGTEFNSNSSINNSFGVNPNSGRLSSLYSNLQQQQNSNSNSLNQQQQSTFQYNANNLNQQQNNTNSNNIQQNNSFNINNVLPNILRLQEQLQLIQQQNQQQQQQSQNYQQPITPQIIQQEHNDELDAEVLEFNDNSTNSNNDDTMNNSNNNDSTNSTTTTTSARFDLPILLRWIEVNLPFLFILLTVFLYNHRQGILVFLWQQIVFMHVNQAIKNQVALQHKRSIVNLFWVILTLSSNIVTTYFFFSTQQLWLAMIFIPPKLSEFDIWSSFWVVILSDFMARFAIMIVKSICIIVVGHRPPYKRRGQLYSAIESANQLYRSLLPITIWVSYLYSLQKNGDHIFSSVMIGLYLTVKLSSTIERAKLCFSTLRAFILHEVLYGKKATNEQIMEAGDVCSICRSNLTSPIVLRCNHIFCEDCVSQWFEREKTCPLCRSPCRTAGNKTHTDGSTTFYLQLF